MENIIILHYVKLTDQPLFETRFLKKWINIKEASV